MLDYVRVIIAAAAAAEGRSIFSGGFSTNAINIWLGCLIRWLKGQISTVKPTMPVLSAFKMQLLIY